MRGRTRYLTCLLATATVGLFSNPAVAGDTSPDTVLAETRRSLGEVRQGISAIEKVSQSSIEARSAEARIADGELSLRAKDYIRAEAAFNQVIERFPNHPTAYPDALFLLGESYYESKEFLSARRVYRQIVDLSGERRFAPYQGRALARLVDVALRTRDYAMLDDVFARMNSLSSTLVQGELLYARGKGLFAKKDYAGAKTALASVDFKSPHYHQTRYLLGVIAMKEAGLAGVRPGSDPKDKDQKVQVMGAIRARYAPAIELFRQVTQLPADTPEHRHVIDLAWLAIGRLFYETDQYTQASEAYGHIDRTSSEFSTMLYELAWNYVRLGDGDRALRSLEVLSVAEPNSPYLADGTLLRADLLLRTGQFEKSLSLYRSARSQYDPMRGQVDSFLNSTTDPAVYYDKLSAERVEGIVVSDSLPPLAVDWAREGEDGPAAFAVIDNAKACRELLRQARSFSERVASTLNAANRVRAFPALKLAEEQVLSALNRTTRLRQQVALALDKLEDEHVAGEAQRVRGTRRSLQPRLAYLPVSDADFNARDEQAQSQWNAVSQARQQLTLAVDQLQAVVNGLKRMMREAPSQGIVRDPAVVRQQEAELAQNEQDFAVYKAQIAELRRQIELSRAQVGFADQRFVEDAQARNAYRKALEDEARLAVSGSFGKNAVTFATILIPVLEEANLTDGRLAAAYTNLEAKVDEGAQSLRAQLDQEIRKLTEYAANFDALDSESRLLVGEIAKRNFTAVRDRLKNIVLRADVGVTEEAWELRDEEMTRVRNLQLERARSDQRLSDELREVLDDSGEASSANQSGSQK